MYVKEDELLNPEDVKGREGALLTFLELSKPKFDQSPTSLMSGFGSLSIHPDASAYLDHANAKGIRANTLNSGAGIVNGADNAITFSEWEVEKMPGAIGAGYTSFGVGMRLREPLCDRVIRWCKGAMQKMAEARPGEELDVRCVFAMETALTQLPRRRDITPDRPVPNAFYASFDIAALAAFFIEANRRDGSLARLVFPVYAFGPL